MLPDNCHYHYHCRHHKHHLHYHYHCRHHNYHLDCHAERYPKHFHHKGHRNYKLYSNYCYSFLSRKYLSKQYCQYCHWDTNWDRNNDRNFHN